jgi:hypothetical protein
MSSPADSGFLPILPFSATGIDLIERLQLPSDSLYPADHRVTSFDVASDSLARIPFRFGAPPRTPNGSYLSPSLGTYPLLLRSWMLTVPEPQIDSNGHTGSGSDSRGHTGTDSRSHTGTDSRSHTGTDSRSHTGTDSRSHTGTDSRGPPPARLRQAATRFRELGTTSSIGGFVCIAAVAWLASSSMPLPLVGTLLPWKLRISGSNQGRSGRLVCPATPNNQPDSFQSRSLYAPRRGP